MIRGALVLTCLLLAACDAATPAPGATAPSVEPASEPAAPAAADDPPEEPPELPPPEPGPPPPEPAPPPPEPAPRGEDAPAPPSGELRHGMPVEWLACEQARDCTYVTRGDVSDLCAPQVVPVARAHLADALRRYPRRPCPHGPPGHGCPPPMTSCRQGECAVRARSRRSSDDGLGL